MANSAFKPGDIVVLKSETSIHLTVVGPAPSKPDHTNCVFYERSPLEGRQRFCFVDLPDAVLKSL